MLNEAKGLPPDFLAAAADLVDLGAEAITTNCGFLSPLVSWGYFFACSPSSRLMSAS